MIKRIEHLTLYLFFGILLSTPLFAQEFQEVLVEENETHEFSQQKVSFYDPGPNGASPINMEVPSEEKTVVKLPQVAPYSRPDAGKRFKRYINSTVGPFALAADVAKAGYFTATNDPEEWGKDAEGFGRRFASNLGERAIQETTIYGLDEALKLDSHFYKSQKRDFSSKLSNAVISTVTARKENGKRVVGVPRIVGTYGSRVIAREAWYPNRYDYKDGLKSGSISLGFNAVFNLFREFVLK